MLINRTHSAHAREGLMRNLLKSGAPGEIRTPDLLLRRQLRSITLVTCALLALLN